MKQLDVATKQSTTTITIEFDLDEVESAQTQALIHIGEHKKINGFREGKAPLSLLKNSVSDTVLKEETLHHLANQAAQFAIDQHKFDLVSQPYLQDSKTPAKAAWTLTLAFPLYPKFDLKNYQDIVKAIPKPKSNTKGSSDRLDKIIAALTAQIKLDVPQILIDHEVQHSIGRLIDQAKTLNLDLGSYLKAIKKTPETVQKEYVAKAEESLKMEFILTAIGEAAKIEVTPAEVNQLGTISQATPDQLSQVKSVLLRRKTIDFLLKL